MTLSRHTAMAVAGIGLYAAVAVAGSPPGLALFVAALLVAAVVAPYAPRGRWNACCGALALLLAGSAVLRDARWVVTLDLIAALGLAVLARVEASGWAYYARAVVAALRAVLHVPGAIGEPALVAVRQADGGRLLPIARGTALAALLGTVFGTLFATADRAFAALAGDVLNPDISLVGVPRRLLVGFAVVGVAGALVLLRGVPHGPGREPRSLRRAEWVTPLATLVLVFAAFVAVQVTVLFGGEEHVLGTAGLTYAQYAREGFFQLLAVAALTLAVVAAAVRWVPRSDRWLLRLLLGPLCALTLVVLGSAWRRLALYEEAYGATRLRVSVAATILWLGVVFLLVLAAGIRMRAAWLPQAVVVSAAAGLLVFTVSNPDARIAERNVARPGPDLTYLATLSADAIPAVARAGYDCTALAIADRRLGGGSWASGNLGRFRAAVTMTEVAATPGCAYR